MGRFLTTGGKIMKRKLLPVIVLGLVLLSAAAALADGDIYVGGPWGTRITSLPYTISAPGSYYLGRNLSSTSTGITITAGVNNVTLDLMGFSITGPGSNSGILMSGSKNVEVRNGTVTGWNNGIFESGSGLGHRIINVRAVGNNTGIWLGNTGHLVKGCEVSATGGNPAIYIYWIGTITGCTVRFATGEGILFWGGIASGNVITGGGAGYGIGANMPGSLVTGNKVSGCGTGISGGYGVSVIDNTVQTASGTYGIALSDHISNVLDQNTVLGSGTPYSPTLAAMVNTKKRSNY